ncbi:E3 ubiquitin-protein ligase [Vitis vinifera]|uniref:E3 ubiquitin-protein ligase n=1 Tax=Vitis vinifera TaxID=29760 RepID=A0A438GZB8_VITVI|nr:E3 ubiquitin-protein ligase [Vitis vinifera]
MANQNYGGEQHMIDIEEIPPIPTNQNSSTSSHVHSLDSGLCLSIQLILTVTQMVASLVVLWVSMAQEHRYPKLFPWVMGYASGCALMLPLLYSRYRIARTLNLGSSEEAEKLFGVVRFFKMTLSCFFLVWLVLGIVMPSVVSLWMFVYAIPGMRFASLCLFLPCLICATLVSPHEKPRGATPESINELPTYKFKSKENGRGEGGVWAAGTIKERTLSEEDAVCCICLGQYADNEELRELPCCSHFFHAECVDQWLKIKACCPLCQSELGGAGGAAT